MVPVALVPVAVEVEGRTACTFDITAAEAMAEMLTILHVPARGGAL